MEGAFGAVSASSVLLREVAVPLLERQGVVGALLVVRGLRHHLLVSRDFWAATLSIQFLKNIFWIIHLKKIKKNITNKN